jgi:hypothetical protein
MKAKKIAIKAESSPRPGFVRPKWCTPEFLRQQMTAVILRQIELLGNCPTSESQRREATDTLFAVIAKAQTALHSLTGAPRAPRPSRADTPTPEQLQAWFDLPS